jgi:hypothetical protein
MMQIYVGFAVIVALVLIGFGASNWFANRARAQATAFDLSTPSPRPAPSAKPIQVQDLKPIGQATGFPVPDLRKGIVSDTTTGGHGQDVDGIPCQSMEVGVVHVHSHLSIFDHGKQVQVPAFIGITPTATGGCLYWLHTHGPDGIIHVEAGDVSAPNGGPYTLGMFFDIWGQPLTSTQVGPFKGAVTAYVNGQRYDGDLKAIALRAHQVITLEVGTPVVPPPNYKLPPND